MKALANLLFVHLIARVAANRPPNFIVGATDPQGAYLRRWYLLPRNTVCNIYLHHFLRSDDDRALHDHPWHWASLLLRGRYVEHTIAAGGVHQRRMRQAGSLKLAGPKRAHRVELIGHETCWTLFITGPRVRDWGFHCPDRGWVHFMRFTKPGSVGERGPGCDA